MKNDLPAVSQGKETEEAKKQTTEREFLLTIMGLQARLNSKMFEFMRAYQQSHNWGGDSNMFRDGSGGETKVSKLYDEVNELGVALNQAVSAFTGESLFEKRDESGRVLAHCKYCKKESPFTQVFDSPYGMAGAYLDGTERLVCSVCKKDTIYPGDNRLPKFNSIFETK